MRCQIILANWWAMAVIALGSTQFSAQAPVFVSQVALIMVQARGRHAQCLSNSILAATGRSAQDFARAGFIIRTPTEPGTKVVCSLESSQIIAQFGHQGNTG